MTFMTVEWFSVPPATAIVFGEAGPTGTARNSIVYSSRTVSLVEHGYTKQGSTDYITHNTEAVQN